MSGRHTAVRFATLLLIVGLSAPVVPAFAQSPSPNFPDSGGLVEQPKKYDGKTVEFTGEAIGEVMVRGEYAWIHINDDAYYVKNVEEGARLGGYNSGMAVWVPASITSRITHYGDFQHEGDIVTVRGVFNAVCAEHGGDMDIHADELVVDVRGRHVVDEVKPWKLWLAVALSLIAALLYVMHRSGEASRTLGPVSRRR
ncbi:MAG: hypothetical protein Q8K89_00110 [Actinomycetota bacterium]|nr:hypothetical protein [Actinomycetota bacterium]